MLITGQRIEIWLRLSLIRERACELDKESGVLKTTVHSELFEKPLGLILRV